MPRPPTLLTAATRYGPVMSGPMGAEMIGYAIPGWWHRPVCIARSAKSNVRSPMSFSTLHPGPAYLDPVRLSGLADCGVIVRVRTSSRMLYSRSSARTREGSGLRNGTEIERFTHDGEGTAA
jgi:hypothetical protein